MRRGPGGDRPASRVKLTDDQRAALNILTDQIRISGKTGQAGVPHETRSVTVEEWRAAFYKQAKPGDEPATKKAAFRRAKDRLVKEQIVFVREPFAWPAE